jgi:hypothetical protein
VSQLRLTRRKLVGERVQRGEPTIRTLSARYIADLQDDWEEHGKEALKEYRERFPERYVENYAMLARIIRVEADVKHSTATPFDCTDWVRGAQPHPARFGRRQSAGTSHRPVQTHPLSPVVIKAHREIMLRHKHSNSRGEGKPFTLTSVNDAD